jgi:PIN domain nuclease of toxin-antitoxin system
VVKSGFGRVDFTADPRRLRHGLLDAGYREIPVTSDHAAGLMRPPPIHKDPFDRVLVAQAEAEGATLVTADPILVRYAPHILLVASLEPCPPNGGGEGFKLDLRC